jgi:hypothetical protein
MEQVTFNETVIAELLKAQGSADLLDESGKILGVFYPNANFIKRQQLAQASNDSEHAEPECPGE